MHTRSFRLTCPITGDTVPAHLNGAELFTTADIDQMAPETQIWWSEILRQYALLRETDPTDAAILAGGPRVRRSLRRRPPERSTAGRVLFRRPVARAGIEAACEKQG
jgi:hypothetical protein